MKFDTKLLHGELNHEEYHQATLPPIFQSNAFQHSSAEKLEKIFQNKAPGFSYTRINNPTVDAFEKRMTTLEGGIGSVACSSGMAAIFNAIVNILETGDEILSSASVFGGTIGLFQDLQALGIQIKYIEHLSKETIDANVNEHTKVIFGEVIGNPKLDVLNIQEVADAAHEHGIVCIIDNTAATSFLVQPLFLGADIVIQSSSKYINGSSNSISGIITDSGKFKWDIEKYPQMKEYKKMGPYAFLAKLRNTLFRNTGACLSPTNAFLNYIGLETLGVRMERICKNAEALAKWFNQQEEIEKVQYPGLSDNPWYETAKQQFQHGFGGLITIRLGSKKRAFQVFDALKIPLKVSNIGDTKTLVIHPSSTIYAHSTEEEKIHAGVYDDLIRISVGLEDVDDLIEDFAQALHQIEKES